MSYPIQGDLRNKEMYAAVVRDAVRYYDRLNQGDRGFWTDCISEDGHLVLNGRPHGIFSLKASSKEPCVVTCSSYSKPFCNDYPHSSPELR